MIRWLSAWLRKPTASDAARTLSRHGHAKARARYREFHDVMAKAAGRPPIKWAKGEANV